MAAIFLASATPSNELPQFGGLDSVVKKGGHMLAYAFLALLYLRALEGRKYPYVEAWILAVAYALVDEFHQSFVPGRHPSLFDAFIFDGGGAAIVLASAWLLSRREGCPANRHLKQD